MFNYDAYLREVDELTRKWKSTTEIVMIIVCAFVNIALNLLTYTHSEALSKIYEKLGVNLSIFLFIISILPLFMLTTSVLKFNKAKPFLVAIYLATANIPTFYNLHYLSVNPTTSSTFSTIFMVNIVFSVCIIWLFSQVSFNHKRVEETMLDREKYPAINFVLKQIQSNPSSQDKHGLDLLSEIEYIYATVKVKGINYSFARFLHVIDEARKIYFASENYVSVKVRSSSPQQIRVSIDGTTKTMNLETAQYLMQELETAVEEINEAQEISFEEIL